MYEDEISRIAFADPDMVRHLLALLPADAVAGLDTRRLRRLPAEQIGRRARRRVADMAWAVGAPTPERPDAEALLVIEFQSTPHARMALRMDVYVALLRQDMAAGLRADAGLPPVLPVLVYTSDRPWRPPGLRQLTAPAPAGLRRWQPHTRSKYLFHIVKQPLPAFPLYLFMCHASARRRGRGGVSRQSS